MTPYPVKFRNNARVNMPAFGIFRLTDGTRQSSGELNPYSELVEATGEEALYVNGGFEIVVDGYGNCQSIGNGPFWVRCNPDSMPSAGDVVGPVAGETYVDSTGSGIAVIYVDTDKELALCESLGGGGTGGGDEGFPPGVVCDCNHCLQGVVIPDALECCRSHTAWEFLNPWLECEETDLVLEYMGEDKWITDPFLGPNGNEYRFQLTIDIDGRSYLTLLLETDNGGDPVCLRYGRDGFDCQCDNALTVKKPWGKLSGIDRQQISCNVCLKPPSAPESMRVTCAFCDVACDPPVRFFITVVSDVTDNTGPFAHLTCSGCESYNGVFYLDALQFSDGGASENYGPSCHYYSQYFDIEPPIVVNSGVAPYFLGSDENLTRGYYVLRVNVACSTGVTLEAWATNLENPGGSVTGTIIRQLVNRWNSTDVSGIACGESVILTESYIDGTSPCCKDWPSSVSVSPIAGGDGPATDSGACEDEDCADTEAPIQPQSACCLGDGHCYEYIDAALCADFGGTFYEDLNECREICETTGGCCFPGDVCVEDITDMECTVAGGISFHPLQVCAPGLCIAPTGACCVGGVCTSEFEADCDGEWREGENCADVDCTIGCCCHPTVAGACGGGNLCIETDNMTGETCEELNGDFTQEVACSSLGCNCNGTTFLCRIP